MGQKPSLRCSPSNFTEDIEYVSDGEERLRPRGGYGRLRETDEESRRAQEIVDILTDFDDSDILGTSLPTDPGESTLEPMPNRQVDRLSPDELVIAGHSSDVTVCEISSLARRTLVRPKSPNFVTGSLNGCCSVSSRAIAVANAWSPFYVTILDLSSYRVSCCVGHASSVMKMTDVTSSETSLPRLVSGSDDETVRLWNGVTGEEMGMVRCSSRVNSSIRLSQNSHRVYFGTNLGEIHRWNVDETRDCEELTSVESRVYGLAVNDEDEVVYVAPYDKNRVVVYSPKSSADQVSSFRLSQTSFVGEVFYHPQSKSILVHDGKGRIHVHDSRMTDPAVRIFPVQLQFGAFLSEIAQVSEDTFVSVNMTKKLSMWTIGGRIKRKNLFEHGLYAIHSPYNYSHDGEVSGDVVDENQRIEGALECAAPRLGIRIRGVSEVILSVWVGLLRPEIANCLHVQSEQ